MEEKMFINKDNKLVTPEKEKGKINIFIELMVNIFLFQEKLKNMINGSLFHSNKRKELIIKKEWIDKLKHYFDYDKYFGQMKYIIKKLDVYNNYNELILKINNLLPKNYLNQVEKKINDEEIIKKFNNFKNLRLTIITINGVNYYKEEIEIINHKIQSLLKQLFKFEYQITKKFLFGDKTIIL